MWYASLLFQALSAPMLDSLPAGIQLVSFEEVSAWGTTQIHSTKVAQLYMAWEISPLAEANRMIGFERKKEKKRQKPMYCKWDEAQQTWQKLDQKLLQVLDLGDHDYFTFPAGSPGKYALLEPMQKPGKTPFTCAKGYGLLKYRLVHGHGKIILQEQFTTPQSQGVLPLDHLSPLTQLQLDFQTPLGKKTMQTTVGQWTKAPWYVFSKEGLFFTRKALTQLFQSTKDTQPQPSFSASIHP